MRAQQAGFMWGQPPRLSAGRSSAAYYSETVLQNFLRERCPPQKKLNKKIQDPNNAANSGWRVARNGFTTVTPLYVNAFCISSESKSRHPASAAAAKITASQMPRF
jgi:hypothetical protein